MKGLNSTMNCRYCENVYADEDRTCGGCGAPKHALRQKLLDAPATPEHWSNSLKDTVYRVLIGSVCVIVFGNLALLSGLGVLGGTIAFFWAVPIVPCLLTYAAWRDSKGDWVGFFMRCFLVMGVWMAVSLVVLMGIGIASSF